MAAVRAAKVPMPSETAAVSPVTTVTPSRSTPNFSAAICASVVLCDWPCGVAPVYTTILPVVETRTVALSYGPSPVASTALEIPMPRWRPDRRACAWRSRNPS